jgi:hypothetical protein
MILTFANYELILRHLPGWGDGARVVYGDRAGTLVRDPAYNGGYHIDGRSIQNILEESDLVQIIS